MTRAIPGEAVRNPFFNSKMYAIAYYRNDQRAIYSDLLPKFVSHIKKRNQKHWQNIIVITGKPGSGKSNLMLQIAMALYPDIDMEKALIYSNQDFRRRLKAILNGEDVGKINLFDEGSVILNAMNARRSDDNGIVTLLEILRSWEMTTIICIPAYKRLNKALRTNLVDYWIQCPRQPLVEGYKSRGFYEIYTPTESEWTDNTYWNCIGAGVYGPLRPEVDEVYQSIKMQHQREQVANYLDGFEDDEEGDEE